VWAKLSVQVLGKLIAPRDAFDGIDIRFIASTMPCATASMVASTPMMFGEIAAKCPAFLSDIPQMTCIDAR
jgi:hypothetical protein